MNIVDLDHEYSVVEIPTPGAWVGKTLIELDLRKRYGINVIGIRGYLEDHMNVCPDPDYRIEAQDHIVIVSGSDEIWTT